MKKTLITTLIIFVVSFILTVCFAVALGANGFNALLSGDGIESFFKRLEGIEDKFDDFGDRIEDKFDFDVENEHESENGKTVIYEESDELEFTQDEIFIGADAAEVVVIPSENGKRIAKMEVYSHLNSRTERDNFSLKVNFEGYDVYVKENEQNAITSAKLYVYIPDCVKTVKIKSNAGEVKVKNLTLTEIDVSLNAGDVELKSITAEKCKVKVNTGEVELENGFRAYETEVKVDTGDIKYEIPSEGNIDIKYSTGIGTIKIDEDVSRAYIAYDKDENEVKVLAKDGKIIFVSESSSLLYKLDLEVSVGKLEIDQDN